MGGLTKQEETLYKMMQSIANKMPSEKEKPKNTGDNKPAQKPTGFKLKLKFGQKLLLFMIALTGIILYDAAIGFGLIEVQENETGWYVHQLMDWIYEKGQAVIYAQF